MTQLNKFTTAQSVSFSDIEEIKKENQTFYFGKIGIAFIDDHYGLRPGNLHVISSGTSSGKTTIAKTICAKYSYENKILWYSSEENLRQWKSKFEDTDTPREENIKFISEEEIYEISKTQNDFDFFKHLSLRIEDTNSKILFFDNITASSFYNDKTPKEQSDFLRNLKKICTDLNIPIFMVSHLAKNSPAVNFRSNNVRGNNTLPTIAQYWYNFYRLRLSDIDLPNYDTEISIIHVEKSRDHREVNDSAYQVLYSRNKNTIIGDKRISWTVANELISKSQKNGKK